LATRQVSARPAYAVVQVDARSPVGLLALVLLVLLRTDLVGELAPGHAPGRPQPLRHQRHADRAERRFQQGPDAMAASRSASPFGSPWSAPG